MLAVTTLRFLQHLENSACFFIRCHGIKVQKLYILNLLPSPRRLALESVKLTALSSIGRYLASPGPMFGNSISLLKMMKLQAEIL